jgi:hypothetical protein
MTMNSLGIRGLARSGIVALWLSLSLFVVHGRPLVRNIRSAHGASTSEILNFFFFSSICFLGYLRLYCLSKNRRTKSLL